MREERNEKEVGKRGEKGEEEVGERRKVGRRKEEWSCAREEKRGCVMEGCGEEGSCRQNPERHTYDKAIIKKNEMGERCYNYVQGGLHDVGRF